MMFYVFVPVLYSFIKNLRSGLIFFFAISSIDIALNLSFFTQGDWFHYFWLVNQLPVFSLGIVLYFIYKEQYFSKLHFLSTSSIIIVLFLGMIGLAFFSLRLWYSIHILYAVLFLVFSIALGNYKGVIFKNKYINYVGEISFSCYLVHFGVVWSLYRICIDFFNNTAGNAMINILMLIILYFATAGITVLISSLTYRYIEKPGINLGKRLINRAKDKGKINIQMS